MNLPVAAEGQAFREKPITCLITVVMVVLFFSSLISPSIVTKVSLIVSETLMSNFYVWNIVTGSLLETNFLKLLVGVGGVIFFGSRAEGALGIVGFAQYVAVLLVACGIATSTYIFIAYVITRSDEILFMPMYGPVGLVAGFSVAVAQSAPDFSLPFPGLVAKIQYFPLCLALIWTAISFIYQPFARDWSFVWSGAYFGWFYLRFICPHDDGAYGDTTTTFAFTCFFPEVSRKFIQPVCNFCYGVMILLGFFRNRKVPLPTALSQIEVQHEPPSPIIPLPAKRTDPVSERRRATANKLLDEKLAQIAQQEVDWKDDDEEPGPIGGDSPHPSLHPTSSKSSLPVLAGDGQDGDEDNWGLEEEDPQEKKSLDDSGAKSEKRKVVVGKAD